MVLILSENGVFQPVNDDSANDSAIALAKSTPKSIDCGRVSHSPLVAAGEAHADGRQSAEAHYAHMRFA
jgi:hypothetical protein